MSLLPHIIAYVALAVFVVAVVVRIVFWSRMPLHVRWELYPVAHEGKRARYGGSYLEEVDWWKKPREVSVAGELRVMVPEILFLVALKENNKKLWVRSFPFHFGLYLVIGATVLMMGGGVLQAVLPGAMGGGLGRTIQVATVACGASGLCLGLLGAAGLLHRRLTDPVLQDFSSPADIFNLVFFMVTFGVALLTFLVVDLDFSRVTAFVHGLVTFQFDAMEGRGLEVFLPAVSVVLMGLLVAYIPLTHMSHFVGKYFAYHAIRWNDEPNLRGGDQEKEIQKVLGQPIDWSADHIEGDGKKTWVDVATEEMSK